MTDNNPHHYWTEQQFMHLQRLMEGPFPHAVTNWRSVRRVYKDGNIENRIFWHDEIGCHNANTHRRYSNIMGRLYEQYYLTFSAN